MQLLQDRLLTAIAGSEEQMTLLTIMRILDDPQGHHPEWAQTYIDEQLETLLPPTRRLYSPSQSVTRYASTWPMPCAVLIGNRLGKEAIESLSNVTVLTPRLS